MIRTAIFGGTFNPLHNGHMSIARFVISNGLADELWLMVTPQNPWKRNQALMDDEVRLEMARRAVADEDRITVSDYEFSLPRPSYTADTLRSLKEHYPGRCFSLVIGADNWAKFDNWYDSGYILEHHQIIVYPRSGYPMPAGGNNVLRLNCGTIDVSSTEIRERIAAGLDVKGLVPDAVSDFLRLYKTDSIS